MLSRRENFVACHGIFRHLRFDDGFKTAVALPTAPNMTDLPLITILRPFGRNQLIVAIGAVHPEAETAFDICNRDLLFRSAYRGEVKEMWQ
jgi:hypothetical protein